MTTSRCDAADAVASRRAHDRTLEATTGRAVYRQCSTLRRTRRAVSAGRVASRVAQLGAVQERSIGGLDRHPYHQHTHPFQLISFGEAGTATGAATGAATDLPTDVEGPFASYFAPGDWHDTWQDANLTGPLANGTMRCASTQFEPEDLCCLALRSEDLCCCRLLLLTLSIRGTTVQTGRSASADACSFTAIGTSTQTRA